MAKFFVIIFFLIFTTGVFGQLNVKFVGNSNMDELLTLELKKDGTYKYARQDLFSDHIGVLDSGTYELNKKQLTFQSLMKSTDPFGGQKYYLSKTSKRRIPSGAIHTRRKTFIHRVLILHKGFR